MTKTKAKISKFFAVPPLEKDDNEKKHGKIIAKKRIM